MPGKTAYWWSKKMSEALENIYGAKFKTLKAEMKKNQFIFFEVNEGEIKAKIARGKQKPQFLKIKAGVWSENVKTEFLEAFRDQKLWYADLLNGFFSPDMEKYLNACQTSLIPRDMLSWELTCGDAAGRYPENYKGYVLLKLTQDAVSDPFILLRLFGISKGNIEENCALRKEPVMRIEESTGQIKTLSETAASFWRNHGAFAGSAEIQSVIEGFRNPLFNGGKNPAISERTKKMNADLQSLHVRIQKSLKS